MGGGSLSPPRSHSSFHRDSAGLLPAPEFWVEPSRVSTVQITRLGAQKTKLYNLLKDPPPITAARQKDFALLYGLSRKGEMTPGLA
jgi:hypothetical protein